MEKRKDVKKIPITSMTLYVTEACNLACPYCFVHKNPANMTWETAKDCVDWLIEKSLDAKNLSITYFGGEPSLRWELVKQITTYTEDQAKARGKEAHFSMTTNGVYLPGDFNDFVFADGRKFGILLSMDGDAETQNANRPMRGGGESFPFVNKMLENLLKQDKWRNNGTQVRLTWNKQSIKQLHHNLEYLFNKGVTSVAPMPVEEELWSPEELDIARKEFWKVANLYIDKYREGKPVYIKIFHDILERQISPVTRLKKRSIIRCGHSVSQVAVDPYGNLWPCHRMLTYDKSTEGKIFNQGSIYDKDDTNLNRIRESFQEAGPDNVKCIDEEKCKYCPVVLSCGGGCTAVNYEVCNEPYTRPLVTCDMKMLWFEQACRIDNILGPAGEKNELYLRKFYSGGKNNNAMNNQSARLDKVLVNLHNKINRQSDALQEMNKKIDNLSNIVVNIAEVLIEYIKTNNKEEI
jgi:uncharacterized protein